MLIWASTPGNLAGNSYPETGRPNLPEWPYEDLPEDSRYFYLNIRELLSRLDEAGHHQWASDLSAAMATSSVGSEVVGKIGVGLHELADIPIPEQLGIADDLDACRNWVREIWQGL